MSNHKGARKTLAVFMAVLMVMSCWVFTPISLKAEALSAGTYNVVIKWRLTNRREAKFYHSDLKDYTGESSFDKNSNETNRVGVSLYYKTENGTGEEREVYWSLGNTNYVCGQKPTNGGATVTAPAQYVDSAKGDYELKATLPGFPTRLFACLDDNHSFQSTAYAIKAIIVNGMTIWGAGSNEEDGLFLSSTNQRKYVTLYSDYSWVGYDDKESTESNPQSYAKVSNVVTKDWVYPKATNIVWDTDTANWSSNNLKDVTISTGSADVSRLAKFHVVDRYNVNMSTAALNSLNTAVGATVTSTNYPNLSSTKTTLTTTNTNNLYYTTTDTNANYQVNVVAKSALKSTIRGLNERLVTVTAKAGTGVTSSKTFKIYDPKYTITFNANGGQTLTPSSARVYYGESLESQQALDGAADKLYPTSGTRAGHSYLGLFDAKTGGNKINTDESVTAGKTYYAHWDANTYTVVFLDRIGKYLHIEYVPYESAADTSVAESKLDKYEPDGADGHYKLNESNIWSVPVNNVTQDMITTAQYTYESHNFEASHEIAANCQHGKGTVQVCSDCGYEKITETDTTKGPHTPATEMTVVEPATCTTTGTGVYYCTVCGDPAEEVEIPAEGHSYKSEIVKAATCTAEGERKFTCTKCGYIETEVIPKTQHDYREGTYQHATCATSPYTEMVCSVCGASYKRYEGRASSNHNWVKESYDSATGILTMHCDICDASIEIDIGEDLQNFTDATVTKQPTCNEVGKVTVTCGDDSYTIDIPKTTTHNYETTVNNATCTAAGSVVNTCSVCGKTETVATLPALGHSYDEGVIKTAATCTAAVVMKYTCTRSGCGNTKETAIPAAGHKTVEIPATCTTDGKTVCAVCKTVTATKKATGHTWGAEVEQIKATCVNKGLKTKTCTVCDHTDITITPTTDHTWNADKTVDYDSTCSTLGQKSTHCSICGTVKDGSEETIAKKAHTMGTAQTVVEPTCTGKGVTKTVCSVCGYTETATVAALGHDYSVTVSNTNATCTEAGVKTLKCSRCGDENTVVTQPTGHKFVAGTPVAASCKDAGHVTMTCACGESYEKYISAPTNEHNWSYTVSVSHGKTVISGKCSVCGATFSTSADSDHELTKVKSYTPATCKSEGTLVLECAVSGCTQNHTVTLAVNLNAHANVTVTETKANCTSDGSIVTKCADCGKTLSTTAVPKTGHAFNTQTDYTAPTCKSEGSVTYKCDACNETKTDKLAINPDAHKFTKGAHHNADCTHPEYDEYKCDYCGESYNSFSGSANGHTYTTTTSQSGTTLTITCKCSVCGDTHTQTVEVAEGHNYTDVTVDKEPTCAAEGTMTIACDGKHKAGCASVITVSVPKNSKAHNIETRYTAPDCKTGGSVITACANGCGLTENRIDIAPLGHEWDNGEVTTAASCESDGVMTYTCTRGDCGETRTEVIAKLGHKWNGGESHEADCTHGDYTRFTCETCGKTYDDVADGATALGHSWNSGVVTAEPTCTEDGVKTYTCNRCGETKTEAVSKLGHSYVEGAHHDATCTSAAYTEYKCANCDSSYNAYDASRPAVGHNWGAWSETKEATNSEDGVMSRTCSKCGDTETVTVPKGGHTLALKSEVPATCSSEGKQIFACTAHENCGVSIEVATAKLAHTLKTTVVPATCTAAGSVTTECTKCGEVNEVTEIPALGHAYDDEHSEKHEADCTHSGYTTYTCTRNCGNTINVYDKDAEGHVWSKTAVGSTATCTERGMATYKCEKCNSTIEVEAAALGHDYSELTETVEATCNSVGHKTYNCSRCAATHTEYSDKLGEHKFGALQEIQTATDVLPGIKVRKCETCGLYEYDYTAPTGAHEYDGGVVTKKATCTQDGEKTYTCISEHCGCTDGNRATYTEVIPATGHDKVLDFVDATCVEDGHATVKCTVCGAVFENKTVSAKGHTYGDVPSSATAPTCSKNGKIVYNCTVCGDRKTVTVEKVPTAHNWVLAETQTADCTHAGYEIYNCANTDESGKACAETYKKYIKDPTVHTVDESKTETKAATCNEAGYTKKYCACGQLLSAEIINPDSNAHNWVEKTAEASGCLKSGYTYKECSVCGQIKDITVGDSDGHKYAQRTAKEATCDVGGEIEIYCEACDTVVKKIETAPLGHDYDEGVTVEATCNTAGSVTFTCKRDGSHKLTKELPTTPHKYVKKESVAATCTNSAYDLFECEYCGDSYKAITGDAAAHAYAKLETSTEAGCITAGHSYYKCENCDAAYDYEIPAKGHSYTAEVTQDATCDKPEITTYTCSNCGDSYTVITKVPTAHSWSDWKVTTAATENTAGEEERLCETCGLTETAPIPATGSHVMREVTEQYVPATCETEGKRVYVCTTHENCTADYTVTIPALGHLGSIEYKNATCKEAGYANLVCKRDGCGATLETNEIPQLKHSYTETARAYPTCTNDGAISYKCDNCGETTEATLPATGAHKLTFVKTVEATCTTQGYTLYKCADCDYTCIKDLTKLAAHTAGEAETVVEPTCTTSGYKQTKCKDCDTVLSTELIVPTPHSYTETVTKTVENADGDSCLKAEYTYNKCSCGAVDESSITVTAPKGHDWGEWTVVTPSSNTEDGKMQRVCNNDASHVETVIIPKGGHEFDTLNPTGETPATCHSKGEKTFECTAHVSADGKNTCGVTITVETEMLAHELETVRKDGNCTEAGTVTTKCVADGCTYSITTEIPALGHIYGEGEITKEATCQTEGEVTFSCTREGCDHKLTKATPTVPHEYKANGEPVKATCLKSGYQNYKCVNCDDNYDVILEDATGHRYAADPNHEDIAATCTTEGHVYKKCVSCDANYSYAVSALGHNYSELTETVEATCNSVGHKTYKCSRCNDTNTVYDSELADHTWGEWKTVQTATDELPGIKIRQCDVCKLYEYDYTAPTGAHDYDDGVITKAPTCTEDGIKTYTCKRTHCDCTAENPASYTQTLPATGHKAKLEYSDATCAADGYVRTVCDTCKTVLEEQKIAKKEHIWTVKNTESATCEHGGKITYECGLCKLTRDEETAAVNHEYVATGEYVEATCTTPKYEKYACTYCHGELLVKVGEADGHDTVENYVKVKPETCTEAGYSEWKCHCGEVLGTKVIQPAKHTWETVGVTLNEECDGAGYSYEKCSVCGVIKADSVKSNEIGHTYTYTTTVEPTCETEGEITAKCNVCDKVEIKIAVPALGHIYGEGEVTKKATCQTEGEVTFSCTREGCDHKLTKATPTVPHEYKANGEPVKATCLKSGYQNYKCVNCDDNYDVILEDATGHRYAKLDTSTEADCTTAGHSYYKCENCEAAYDYEIPAKGHSYIGEVTQDATCAQPEITTYTCYSCYDSYEVITAVPTAHTWSDWKVTKAATENTAGEEERHCEVCGLTETAPIPATDAHVIVEDTEQYVPATCETEGKRVYICTTHENCTADYTVTLAPLGHKTGLRHEDAKCNVGGYSRVVCTVCDKVLAETTIAALKHSFVEIEGTRVAPTCSADGSISYKCENCGEEKTVAVEAVKAAHKLSVYETVESTCTTQGYTLYKCDNCEYTRKDDLKPLAPHKIATNETVSATCTGEGYIKSVCECGAIVSIEAIPATGHTYETKTAEGDSCLTSGYTYEECAVCGNIRNITVSEAANHEYEQRITPATCTEGGTVEIYCKNCDKAVKTITTEALGHNFGGAPTTVNPTCEHEGSVTYSCQRTGCDETLTHKLDKIPHNYQSKGTFPATCKNSGYELFVCADCKAEYKNITTEATGHHYGDDPENANVAATCFEDGHVYKKCKDCDAAYDYVVPATGEHVYDSGTVVTPASCLDSEVTEYRCTTDGCTAAYREVTASAKGHDYTDWTYSHSTATGVCKCGATVTVENVDKEAGHNWVYNRITKAATCKEQGYIEFVCGDGKTCSATLTKAYGPIADAHVWNGGEITAEPDCETDGVKTYTCAECGETKTETVAKLGHEYTEFVEKVEATCVSDGHITYKCSRCDSEKTQVIAKNESNHSYKAVTTDPTCLEDGYTTMICELCGHEGEKTVNAGSALGHDEEVITIAPTCKEAGSRITQCKRCHTVLKTEGIAPVDHTWNDGVITTEPKCETDGVKTYTCAKCGETKTETVARLNHDYSVLVESVDSSCVADGHNTYKCSRCDSAKTELIAKDPDKHTLESVTVAPTCLEDGYTVDRCKLCGHESEKRDIVSALGHDEETIIVARTCTEAGSETVRCKRCEAVLSTHGVAPLGHDYITTPITEATCTDSGENRITCSRCDYLAIETVPAKGHKWDNGTVIAEGDCETKKVTRFTCTQCGITKDVLSGDLGKHDYKFVKTVAPTCIDEGYDLYECSRCHKQQQTKFVEALGHDWGYWNVVKYPTETETGLQERFCNRCGEREEQTIVYGKFYLVTFYNYDGTRLMPPAYYEYGAKALRPKTDPVKAADTAYTYEYIGWNFEDRQIDFVTERMAIIAQYKAHERYYTVTYKDEDGAVLAVVPNIPFSQIAEKYPNGTPTKASDELNDYTFSSWSINCNSNTGEAVATATYKATEKKPGAQPAGKPGIFSKFIEWLRNLFKKLFGRG